MCALSILVLCTEPTEVVRNIYVSLCTYLNVEVRSIYASLCPEPTVEVRNIYVSPVYRTHCGGSHFLYQSCVQNLLWRRAVSMSVLCIELTVAVCSIYVSLCTELTVEVRSIYVSPVYRTDCGGAQYLFHSVYITHCGDAQYLFHSIYRTPSLSTINSYSIKPSSRPYGPMASNYGAVHPSPT